MSVGETVSNFHVAGQEIVNGVIVSDTHSGCGLALLHPDGIKLDDGAVTKPSLLQQILWSYWRTFWDEFVPEATRGEPFFVIHNGDALDGEHHKSTYQLTHNLTIQARIAKTLLEPVVELCQGRYYHIRGTEAHVGKSASEEERLAEELGAIPSGGQFARYDIWKWCGPKLIHSLHHIGTTGSQAYEATALHKELVEEFTESARWQEQPPDLIVRSHRHRNIQTSIPVTRNGEQCHALAVVTPGWQGKTPFVWKIPGGRLAPPQFGGIVARFAHGEFFVREKVWTIERSKVE